MAMIAAARRSAEGTSFARAARVVVLCAALFFAPRLLLLLRAGGDAPSGSLSARGAGGASASVSDLVRLEDLYGGLVKQVPRQVVSKHDPRPSDDIKRGGMTGGDRMSPDRHNYGAVYERILRSLPSPVTAVAEVGILKGSGVAIWSTLFPDATVHGFDVNLVNINGNMEFLKSRGAFEADNLVLHEFDQFEPVLTTGEAFQFVVDDGFHSDKTITKTFDAFEPWLQPGGTYVVEDCDETECGDFLRHMEQPRQRVRFSTVHLRTNDNSDLIVITRKTDAAAAPTTQLLSSAFPTLLRSKFA